MSPRIESPTGREHGVEPGGIFPAAIGTPGGPFEISKVEAAVGDFGDSGGVDELCFFPRPDALTSRLLGSGPEVRAGRVLGLFHFVRNNTADEIPVLFTLRGTPRLTKPGRTIVGPNLTHTEGGQMPGPSLPKRSDLWSNGSRAPSWRPGERPMRLSDLSVRRKSKRVWADPERAVRTLESFAVTETDGGHDITAAARQVTDPDLRTQLEHHAKDELHHGVLFEGRARELRRRHGITQSFDEEADKPFDLTRGHEHPSLPAGELNAHGHMRPSLFDELGEISYIAMLHVAERRAAALFRIHRDLTRDDPETCAIFEEILNDEKFHVAYTGTFLEKWRQQGRGQEVKEALAAAKGSRFLSAWKRAGIRAGSTMGRGLLLVAYFTLVAPFALLLRRGRSRSGWQGPPRKRGDGGDDSEKRIRSQF